MDINQPSFVLLDLANGERKPLDLSNAESVVVVGPEIPGADEVLLGRTRTKLRGISPYETSDFYSFDYRSGKEKKVHVDVPVGRGVFR